ncbi:MAG: hypothetical protein NWE91_01575 [Candidatus Bathyarchaeota archaeon]|nr:hypothetical protein [Candidatus Bathyarchaeota archaeon]
MPEKEEKKDKETGRIIKKRDISGVERRIGRDVREGYEQSGVERRSTEKKKEKEK